MAARFEAKRVLITGAASGIGRATALLFAAEGARVGCADLNFDGSKATVEEIEKAGGRGVALACDVSLIEDARRSVAESVEQLGGLDVLCNVAGMAGFAHSEELAPELWNRFMGVNLNGTFFMSQAALPHLLASSGSSIVNVASLAGLRGQAYCAAYCASKAGVVGLTRSMAIEYLKRGLRVNCVCPGAVKTPLISGIQLPEEFDPEFVTRLQIGAHFCEPEEVSETIAFLASDAASSINGVALSVDGGVAAG